MQTSGMEQQRTPAAFADAVGISVPYASQILNNKRQPSRPLAIHIYRRTGWKHDLIADLTREQMEMLEQIEPWTAAEKAA